MADKPHTFGFKTPTCDAMDEAFRQGPMGTAPSAPWGVSWVAGESQWSHLSELSAGAATSGFRSSSLWPLSLRMTSRPPGSSLQLDSMDFSTWIPRRQKPRFTMAGSAFSSLGCSLAPGISLSPGGSLESGQC